MIYIDHTILYIDCQWPFPDRIIAGVHNAPFQADRAEGALQRALEGFAGIGFQFGAIETLTSLGYVALEKQERDRARVIGFRFGLPDYQRCYGITFSVRGKAAH